MHVTKRVDLNLLETELAAASVVVNGLGHSGTDTDGEVFTYSGVEIVDLPPEAAPVVDAHVAPPRTIDFAGRLEISAKVTTTSATPVEIYRLACEERRVYQSTLTLIGIDAGNFVAKSMEGRFLHKRLTGNALQVGAIVVLSDIHDTAAASWAPNAVPSGPDVVFTVAGAAGRTVNWMMGGTIAFFAPEGTNGAP